MTPKTAVFTPFFNHNNIVTLVNTPVCTHLGHTPSLPSSAFVAPGAVVLGDVSVGDNSSIWYGCVLRADIQSIRIGHSTNLQDGTIIHLASDLGTTVGDHVTCGHRCLLHACTIGDEVLVGMGAIVMDGAEIGSQSIIGAGALVTKGFKAPAGSLILGSPAKIARSLSDEERQGIRHWAEKYVQVALEHSAHLAKVGSPTGQIV